MLHDTGLDSLVLERFYKHHVHVKTAGIETRRKILRSDACRDCITFAIFTKAWFTLLATTSEVEMEAKTDESLRSSVNHENGDGSTSGCSTEAETEGIDRSFFFRHLFCFCQAYVANSKCEPVMMDAQAETEGWAISVSASDAGANQA